MANLANHEPFAKLFPTNIHRYTKNVFGVCTDCSLFAKFFHANSFYLYSLPKFSSATRVWYLHTECSYVFSMLSLSSIVISDLVVVNLSMHSLSVMILLYLAMPYFILKVVLHEFMHIYSYPQLIIIFINACNS